MIFFSKHAFSVFSFIKVISINLIKHYSKATNKTSEQKWIFMLKSGMSVKKCFKLKGPFNGIAVQKKFEI
ncbi:hypothetical protein CN326_19250 [Bacillus sp. AFS018417]|nr:hypothetical protein CN326_19250 [Bacillus sp. AFS018417]